MSSYSHAQKLKGIADYNQDLTLNPGYTEAYNNSGLAKSKLADNQGADQFNR